MTIDGKALAKACGAKDLGVATHLCRTQIEEFQRQAKDNKRLLVACTQEAPVFFETVDEMSEAAPELEFTNIRERAGWTRDTTKKATPQLTAKMAALLAEAALDIPAASSTTVVSHGVLLVIGNDEAAIETAKQVSHRLDVTVFLTRDYLLCL